MLPIRTASPAPPPSRRPAATSRNGRRTWRRAPSLATPPTPYLVCVVGRRGVYAGPLTSSTAVRFWSRMTRSRTMRKAIFSAVSCAVVPVCEGINLQYYFSYVDSTGWGVWNQVAPQRDLAALGVMDGAASDLRPGLPMQGVEIHEPVRCLFIIETTPDRILRIMQRTKRRAESFAMGGSNCRCSIPNRTRSSSIETASSSPTASPIAPLALRGHVDRLVSRLARSPGVRSNRIERRLNPAEQMRTRRLTSRI